MSFEVRYQTPPFTSTLRADVCDSGRATKQGSDVCGVRCHTRCLHCIYFESEKLEVCILAGTF